MLLTINNNIYKKGDVLISLKFDNLRSTGCTSNFPFILLTYFTDID